jgi:hypothetical protein
VIWREFAAAAPELAELGRCRIEQFECVMIGTIRRDGGPRVNPVEAYVVDGHLLTNMMPRSLKALDLLRDPRIFVHTLVTSKTGSEGEFKIVGRAFALEDERLRSALDDVFYEKIRWRPPANSHYFEIHVERAVWVRYTGDDDSRELIRWPDRP